MYVVKVSIPPNTSPVLVAPFMIHRRTAMCLQLFSHPQQNGWIEWSSFDCSTYEEVERKQASKNPLFLDLIYKFEKIIEFSL